MGMLNSVMMLGSTSILLNQALFSFLMCKIQKPPHEEILQYEIWKGMGLNVLSMKFETFFHIDIIVVKVKCHFLAFQK